MKPDSKILSVLVLGVSGMLGSTLFRFSSKNQRFRVYGTMRSEKLPNKFSDSFEARIITGVDVNNDDKLIKVFKATKPDIVINCIGVVKQLDSAKDPICIIPINSVFPHRLANLCELVGSRLIHFSTDCVFSGKKGMYSETDEIDAEDLYGRSKSLGEVDYPHAVTLRTSTIGKELGSCHGLLEWFLNQKSQVNGYKRAIFSGLTTLELSRVICDYVIPENTLHGVYQISSEPISKYDLLKLIADVYGKTVTIIPDETLTIDRSLDSTRFRTFTGYNPPSWFEMINEMYQFQ
jgi:dTDP-4-dehydrorhamnose reductase